MGERQVPIWNVPFPQNLFFTGREDILASLHTLLTSNQKAALTPQRQALSGLGGIGKTQTALEYAYRYRHGYQAVLWVKCETPEEFIADVVALAHLLQLPQQDAQDQQITLAAVKRWLETHTQWLLILDNADDLEQVRTFLPGGNSGHILLTTRSDILSGLARKVEITAMREEEGTLLLLRRAGIIAPEASIEAAPFSTQATARALVDEMGGLPLALDQAGAYMEETKCGPAGYLTLYRAQRASLLQRRGASHAAHPAPVATTWGLSFHNVEAANPAAADILRLCAFLAPDAIPEAVLTAGASAHVPSLNTIGSDPFAFNAAVGELFRYSLLARDADASMLTVHRMVQAVLKDEMDTETQRQWAEYAIKSMNSVFPDVTFDVWSLCERYLSHAHTCATHITDWNITLPEAARLLNHTGDYLRERGRYTEALPLYKRALAIYEQELGPHHPSTEIVQENYASLQNKMRQK